MNARTRTAILEELAAGRRPGETWAQWNDRVVALVEALRSTTPPPTTTAQ